MFGSGTAALVSPVNSIFYDEISYDVPIIIEEGAGPLTMELSKSLYDI